MKDSCQLLTGCEVRREINFTSSQRKILLASLRKGNVIQINLKSADTLECGCWDWPFQMKWDHCGRAGCPPCPRGWSQPRGCYSCVWGWGTSPPACSTSSTPPGWSRYCAQTPLRSRWRSCLPCEPPPDHQRRSRSGGWRSTARWTSWSDRSAPAWSGRRLCVETHTERMQPITVREVSVMLSHTPGHGHRRLRTWDSVLSCGLHPPPTLSSWNLIFWQLSALFGILTWAPSFPLTSLGISVWDHFEVPQGDTWVRSVLKFTVWSLLWINCRMFHAKSLCLKENFV